MSRLLTITHRITPNKQLFQPCSLCKRSRLILVVKRSNEIHTKSSLFSKENLEKRLSALFKTHKDCKTPLSQLATKAEEWTEQLKAFETQLGEFQSSEPQASGHSKGKQHKTKRKHHFEEYPSFRSSTDITKDVAAGVKSIDQDEKAMTIIENLKTIYTEAIHSAGTKKKKRRRRKKVKPLFIEHQEGGEADSSVDNDISNMVGELDLLLRDKTISPEMKSDIDKYLKKIKSLSDDNQSPELTWEGKTIEDTPQDANSSSDLFLNPSLINEYEAKGTLRKVTSGKIAKLFGLKVNRQAFDRLMALKLDQKVQDFQEELLSFVDVCVETGMLHMAYTVVTVFYLGETSGSQQPWKKLNIHVYNALMEAMAKRGGLKPLRQLYGQVKELQLTPDLDTIAVYLECLGRQKVIPVKVTNSILEEAKNLGLVLEEMQNQCLLTDERWRYIERAILKVNPDFLPDTMSYQRGYRCDVLAKLNDLQDEPFENPHHGVVSNAEMMKLAEEQIEFEMQNSVVVESIQAKSDIKSAFQIESEKKVAQLKAEWKRHLTKAFESSLHVGEQIYHKRGFMSVVPYLRIFPVETYVDLMIEKIITIGQENVEFSPQLGIICNDMGDRIYDMYMTKKLREDNTISELTEVYKSYLSETNEPVLERNLRETWLEEDHCGLHRRKLRPWSNYVKKQVGQFLLDLMLSDVKIDQNLMRSNLAHPVLVPVLYKVTRYRSKMATVFELKPHAVLSNLLNSAKVTELLFMPQKMPFLAPPIPWCTENFGVDIKGKNLLMRSVVKTGVPPEQIYGVLDALNTVGQTPWKVNQATLDIAIEMFNSGGNKDLSLPSGDIAFYKVPKQSTKNLTKEERIKYDTERNELLKLKKEEYSLYCSEVYRLSIANKYRDRVIWFPHSMDFRGRAYPCSAYFSHTGSDLPRSLLLFAKGKPLGPNGMDWLKIHLINLTGLKKRFSNEARLAYANELMSEIMDSADNPMTGRKWWMESEEPWQTLATCIEIAKATRSPDPQKYICHLPVHQDGSCNGLQHYAAMGRDSKGAVSVNLAPLETPQDVYSDVVELVEKQRVIDAAKGVMAAQILEGFIVRKVIKQTIMTTVYGVTSFGAMQQIRKKLKDMEDFPQEHLPAAGSYLAQSTLSSLQKMFTSSKKIQDWLVLCADMTCGLQHTMRWETPLGLPVVQNYMKLVNVVMVGDQSKKGHSLPRPSDMKQKNAVAPNFVHSLDATHMMLSALFCQRAGISYASVHDCYWTHPSDVPTLNKICREQFVALHQQPILEDLAESLLSRYGFKHSDIDEDSPKTANTMKFINTIFARVPERGDFDLENVLQSTYFFS